jgi:hypothetical protein
MFTMLGDALLIGLGSMKLLELYKEIMNRIGWYQPMWCRSFLLLVCAMVLTFALVGAPVRAHVLIGIGAAGVAMLLHAVDAVLRTYRDNVASEVLSRERTRNRPR